MLIAHLPAGYLMVKGWPKQGRGLMMAGLAGAVFPDLDMIFFHLIDDRWNHHHHYWVHIPGFWLLVAAVTLPLLGWRAPRALPFPVIFLAGVFLHLVLDSLAGGIAWGWPWDPRLHALVEIPSTRSSWVWNFLLHWTFLSELAICAAAGLVWLRGRRSGPARAAETLDTA